MMEWCMTFFSCIFHLIICKLWKVKTTFKISSGSKKETKGSHGPPLREETAINKAPKLMILCLFNPTVKGTWIDQKVQKSWAPSEKQLRSATVQDSRQIFFLKIESLFSFQFVRWCTRRIEGGGIRIFTLPKCKNRFC